MITLKPLAIIGLFVAPCFAIPASASIELIASGTVSGSADDLSGLTGNYGATSDRKAQLGSFGSAIDWTGTGYRFIAVNDRGYSDGTVDYDTRFQSFTLDVDPASHKIAFHLDATHLFKNESGSQLLGSSRAFNLGPNGSSLRLDPEGVRIAANGHLFVSDEYGPGIYEFDAEGKRIRTLPVPAKFQIQSPSAEGDAELTGNTSGRQANRGFEGLAISPDKKTLFAILQSPLLQDGALSKKGKRTGVNNRILQIDIATGKTHEYVYQLSDGAKNGVNELLAVNDHQFLAIERDGKGGAEAKSKLITLIDIAGATDVSNVQSLPADANLGDIKPVTKTTFIDLLDPAYHIVAPDMPEKFEGLAFGPQTPDGRIQLFVTTDNDLVATQDTHIWDFAIDKDSLPGYVH